MKLRTSDAFAILVRCFGVLLFALGGLKFLNWTEFVTTILNNLPLEANLIEEFLLSAVMIEMVLGATLFVYPRSTFLLTLGLGVLVVFAAYNWWALTHGVATCGCLAGTGLLSRPGPMLLADVSLAGCVVAAKRQFKKETA